MTAKFIETVGRRKTASARVRVTPATKQSVTVNGKTVEQYFAIPELVRNALLPLKDSDETFAVTAIINGGGVAGQAHALRHGIARAILAHDSSKRIVLKRAGYLKRDPRAKERRKPGLKKARKAGQWSKR